MKPVILDHLRRWWLLWLLLGIVNCFAVGAFLDKEQNFAGLTFQLILWLGAMQLNFDLQRGIGRALMALPVTAKQLGRAWWILSVALPALLLAATSGLTLLLYSTHTGEVFPLGKFVLTSAFNTFFLGSLFFLMVGALPAWPADALGWLRHVFSIICLFGMLFIRPAFDTPKGLLLLLAAFMLTVAGWFQAERFVFLRAGFRPGIQLGRRKPGRHNAPAGFGGLPFLWQTLFMRVGYMGITVIVWLLAMQLMSHGSSKLSPRQLLEAALPAFSTFGYFFMFMFLLLPMMLQLRQLRTLPISSGALAAMLVLLPTAPIFAAGLVWTIFIGGLSSGGNVFHASSNLLMCAATMSIAAPMFVWQGLRKGSYLLILVLMMLSSLGPLLLHQREIPANLMALVSLGIIFLAFEFTRRLLQSSSQAYRPPPATMTGWGGWGGWR